MYAKSAKEAGHRPDPVALEIARTAQEFSEPAVVILFGSRARGDYGEHSDIDLLVITDDDNPRNAVSDVYAGLREHQKRTGVSIHDNVIGMTRKTFNRCRLAKQHIAGQADTYGVVMNDDPLEHGNEPDDGYPDHWPETKRRIEGAEIWLKSFNEKVEADSWNQREMGFEGQQAVENALKGWLSCLNSSASYTHNLWTLWDALEKMGELDRQETRSIRSAGCRLFRHVEYYNPNRPDDDRDWLSHYAALYRYHGMDYQITRDQRLILHELINSFVQALLEHIHRLSGTGPADVYPNGLRPWETHHPKPHG